LVFNASRSIVLEIIDIGQNASHPDPNIATSEPVTKDNATAKLASHAIEDISEVPSIIMNGPTATDGTAKVPSITTKKPSAKGGTAEKPTPAFEVYILSLISCLATIHILIDKQSIIHFRWCRNQIGTLCHWHYTLINVIPPGQFHGRPHISTIFTPILNLAYISIDISGAALTGIGEQLEQPSNSITNSHRFD
jgi:hypothetical protein